MRAVAGQGHRRQEHADRVVAAAVPARLRFAPGRRWRLDSRRWASRAGTAGSAALLRLSAPTRTAFPPPRPAPPAGSRVVPARPPWCSGPRTSADPPPTGPARWRLRPDTTPLLAP